MCHACMTFSQAFLLWINAMPLRADQTFGMKMFNLTWWHSFAFPLWVERKASCLVKLANISSTIKGYHFYFNSSNFREILECVLELGNKHSRNAMTVLSTKGKTIGHVPEALAKILTLEMAKETTLSLKAEVTG